VNDASETADTPASPASPEDFSEQDPGGFRILKRMRKLLAGLRGCAAHPNRKLHFDEYAMALVFTFFNPVITSLRGLQRATGFEKVRKSPGLRRMSLGSMSESVRVFDPDLLGEIFRSMAKQAKAHGIDPRLEDLGQALTAVDGTVLPALPRMAWAVWLGDRRRGAKAHVQFDVLRSAPVEAEVTDANTSEIERLRAHLAAGRLYVLDRGYRSLDLLEAILDADSSVVVRWHENARYETIEERELTDADREAGVASDRVVRLGWEKIRHKLTRPVRLVEVHVAERELRGLGRPVKRVSSNKRERRDPNEAYTMYLVTDRLDLPADVVALIYRHRWKIELFFRLLKSVFGCRHLLSDSLEGVTIQFYAALMATLLLAEYTGVKPNKRAYELLALYLQGWVTDAELHERLERMKRGASKKP
jgi:DDE family transposase